MYSLILNRFILPWSDKILGLSVQKELELWRKVQRLSKDQLNDIQNENLKDLLNHCSKHVPYYIALAKKVNYNPESHPLIELKKFPLLDKRLIKANLPDRIKDRSTRTYFVDHTSGSSGIRGEFHMDKPAYSKTLAIQLLWWEWAGYRLGDRVLQTGITPKRGVIKGLKDILLRVRYISAYQISSDRMSNILSKIRGTNFYFFIGFGSSLFAYAKFAREKGIHNIRFKSVISWGDKMFSHYRKCIEEQFHTTVFDCYGSCEGMMIAAECEHHNYHIMSPHVFIEILDKEGRDVSPGEMGEIVVTRLDNFHMPLVRYRIGDLAVRADPNKKCVCGRHLPLLERIIGRDTDLVYTPKGKTLVVHFFTGIFEHIKEIQQFQVVQHTQDEIEIRYIPSSSFNSLCLNDIKKEIWNKANEEFRLRFSKVSSIAPSPSGKPQIVESKLAFRND